MSRKKKNVERQRQSLEPWQPMDEAPRDGTVILVKLSEGTVMTTRWIAATQFAPEGWRWSSFLGEALGWWPVPDWPETVITPKSEDYKKGYVDGLRAR